MAALTYYVSKLFLIFLLVCSQWRSGYGFLNIEELKEMQYAVDILTKPVNAAEVNLSEGLQLASKHGQDYFCKLPGKALEMADQTNQEYRLPADYPVPNLLEPLKMEPCLKIVKGWWTYELCYAKFLHQYHGEDGNVEGKIINLGVHESDFNWNDESKIKAKMFKQKRIQSYHSQYYVNGTRCDVLKHPRDAEVRYYCDESAFKSYIERVDEPSTCSYIITVRTHLLCTHPHTRIKHKSSTIDIICQPMLESTKYQRFLDQEARSIQEAYKKANELLKAKRDKLRRLLTDLKTQMLPDSALVNSPSDTDRKMNDIATLPVNLETVGDRKRNEAKEKAIVFIQRFVPEEKIVKLSSKEKTELLEITMNLVDRFVRLPTADMARIVQLEVASYLEKLDALSDEFLERMFRGLSDSTSANPDSNDRLSGVEKSEKGSNFVQVKLRHVHTVGEAVDDGNPDPALRELEEEIGKELKEAGFAPESKIEIHLVTSKDGKEDGRTLTEGEAFQFKEMLLEVMGGYTREDKERERYNRLSDSYNMLYIDADANFVSRQKDKNEDHSSSKS